MTMAGTRSRKAERIARKLGCELNRHHDGLGVNGCHRCDLVPNSTHKFGTYDLVLNVDAERVECVQCGAIDLVRTKGR